MINWILIEEKKNNIKHCPSKLQALLKCSSYVFKTDVLSASLSLEQISSICCALLNIFQFILGEDIVLKEHVPPSNGNKIFHITLVMKIYLEYENIYLGMMLKNKLLIFCLILLTF